MPSKYEQLINEAARKYGLPPDYLHKLIQYESRNNPNAVSPTGATGLAQFTRGTAKQYGLTDRTDPVASIDAAARLALDNKRAITKTLGREPTSSELYLGHLQGAGGASKGFRNPEGRAVDVFGRQAVAVNLPKSQRGDLENITAKQFQDLHQGNFNRIKGGTIDIGDTPQLAQLKPPTPMQINTPTGNLPLSQIAPTEGGSNMARHKYPGYNEAIRQSLTGNTENVEAAPSSFIPPDTDLKGRVKLAGVTLPNIRPPGNKGRFAKDPRADEVKYDRLNPPEKMPGERTPTVEQQEQKARDAHTKQQEMKARVQRGEAPTAATGSGPVITPPPPTTPSAANTNAPVAVNGATGGRLSPRSSLPNSANPTAAFGVGAAAAGLGAAGDAGKDTPGAPDSSDGVLMQIYKMMGGGAAAPSGDVVAPPPIDDTGGLGIPPRAAPGADVAPVASRGVIPGNAPGDNLTIEHLIAQGIPTIKEAMKDPATRGATETVVKKLISTRAAQDAAAADMAKDPTYYQRRASMQSPDGRPADPSDPMYERRMMDAIVRDNQGVMRGRSTPQMPPTQQQQPPRPPQSVPTSATQPPTTEQQILQQAMGPHGGSQAQRFPPSGPPPVGPAAYRQGSMRPLEMEGQFNPQLPNQAMSPPTMNNQMVDPAQAQLWSFFGGGGSGGM